MLGADPETQCICGFEGHGEYDRRTCAPGTYGPWDPGGGPWTGATRRWFDDLSKAPSARKARVAENLTWEMILTNWVALELDFDDKGHDLDVLIDQRTWRWFSVRVLGYVAREDTRIHRLLIPEKKDDDG